MTQITILNILQKIRSICKQSHAIDIPEKVDLNSSINFQAYFKCLQNIRQEFIKYRYLQEEYTKLQEFLQLKQIQIGKKIAAQHQMKLYTEALKSQIQEYEKQKLQILENTKHYIKQLKKSNQILYSQLQQVKNKKNKQSFTPKKTQKSKIAKSVSHSKSKHQKSIRQIIKTQYIQRNRSESNKRKNKNRMHTQVDEKAKNKQKNTVQKVNHNSKTYQVRLNDDQIKNNKYIAKQKSKANIHHLFSNFTILNNVNSNRKKMKKRIKADKQKSQKKQYSKRQMVKRPKNFNKSIHSVSSMQHGSSKNDFK